MKKFPAGIKRFPLFLGELYLAFVSVSVYYI